MCTEALLTVKIEGDRGQDVPGRVQAARCEPIIYQQYAEKKQRTRFDTNG